MQRVRTESGGNCVQPGMKRNLAFSFSSWFCVPELGMKDFEILCRASCFIVPTITPKVKRPHSMYLNLSYMYNAFSCSKTTNTIC
jgi:hypothetical protein